MNNKEYEVKIIKREGDSVRVIDDDGVAMFSIIDFLKVCGYSHHSKKAQRIAKDNDHPGVKKLLNYRCYTQRGPRTFKMYFFDAEAAKTSLSNYPVPPETKRWLESVVLTYNAPKTEKHDEAFEARENVCQSHDMSALNYAIDRLLLDILELKKQVLLSK